jgi:ABC-2 type transport system permease protein
MSKIGIIIRREYITRVRKTSFVVMTILGPLLFAGLMIAPVILMKLESDEFMKIAVIDETRLFDKALRNTDYINFDFVSNDYFIWEVAEYDLTKAKEDLKDSDYYALVYIPRTAVGGSIGNIQMFSYRQPNLGLRMHVANGIEKHLEDIRIEQKGEDYGIEAQEMRNILKAVTAEVFVQTITLDKDGGEKETSTEVAMILGYMCGFLIYIFVFMYGSQVMRGVIEEKTNRIVEVIVSSVRPFQLMAGKIAGVALVGLTQFALWIILTFAIVTGAQSFLLKDMDVADLSPTNTEIGSLVPEGQEVVDDQYAKFEGIFDAIRGINYLLVISMFLFYFIGGYLLYAAMFAAVGSAVDNETDTQQFMLPISLPLILGIIIMMSAINNPGGSLSYWFSIIPFTSPIVMMVRVPFGVPVGDVVLSMALLAGAVVFMTWLAAKIYRTGILMYGKKVNYKELWKWIRYKS